MTITQDKKGGRIIELFIPFDDKGGKTIDRITLAPFTLNDTLLFQDGFFPTVVALLCSLSGLREQTIRQLRYPDADRVMVTMFQMLPQEIIARITEGNIPPPLAQRQQQQGLPQQPSQQDVFSPDEEAADAEDGFNIKDNV